MRSVFYASRRAVAALTVIALLLVPVAAFADDPQINPPHPESTADFAGDGHIQPPLSQAPSFWHIVLFVVTHARVLPFVG
jgi:hypothetical protein